MRGERVCRCSQSHWSSGIASVVTCTATHRSVLREAEREARDTQLTTVELSDMERETSADGHKEDERETEGDECIVHQLQERRERIERKTEKVTE